MPSTSAKQEKFMRAVAHSPKFAKKVGVPQSVGKDFEMADKKHGKFGKGGTTMKPKPTPKPKPPRGFNDPDGERIPTKEEADKMMRPGPFAKGGKTKKYAVGGSPFTSTGAMPAGATLSSPAQALAARKAFVAENHQRAIANANAQAAARQEARNASRPAIGNNPGRPGPMGVDMPGRGVMRAPFRPAATAPAQTAAKKGGKMEKCAKGGGIEKKGKTKGTMVKMAKGGSVVSRADGIAKKGHTRGKVL